MKEMKKTLSILLSIVGLFLIITGTSLVAKTMGAVSGTEFTMLITITHLLSGMAAWIGLYGLWAVIPTGSNDE